MNLTGYLQHGVVAPVTVARPKNCSRCGCDFLDYTGVTRICPSCRKPKHVEVKSRGSVLGKPLSPRQAQIVKLVCAAKLNKEIADELHLSEGTIKVFMSGIFAKAGVSNRTALAIWAIRNHPEQFA